MSIHSNSSRLASAFALSVVILLGARQLGTAQDTEESTPPTDASATSEAADTPAGEGSETAAAQGTVTGEQAQTALTEGQEALDKGDFEKAFKDFTTVLQWGALNPYTDQGIFAVLIGYTGRGQALAGLEEYEAALQEFKGALDQNRDFTPALISRGNMYLELGAADQALPDFEAAVKAARADLRAQFGLGKAYVLLGGWQQAIKPLSRVLDAEPELAEAYRLRGSAYAAMFKNREAIQDLERAVSLNPQDYEAYFTLGMVYLRDEQYEPAIGQLQKSIDNYKPKKADDELPYLQGYLTLSTAYIELGKTLKDDAAKKAQYQTALDVAQKLLYLYDEKNPTLAPYRAIVLYSRASAERMLDDLDTAITTLSEAIELNPDLSEAYFKRGVCYHLLGEDRMAIADFVQSANTNANFEDPRANLWEGFTYAKLGEYHEAIRAYGKAISASDRYTPAFVNRGLAYMKLGQYDKAVADFNEAIRLNPTEAEHYFKRGLAYKEQRELEKASNSFASAIEKNDQHTGAYRHMALTQQALGRTELANEYRQKAEALATQSTR